MAPRATGSATISFGLVSIPVKLYTATSSRAVRFNQINPETGSRVKQQLVDASTGDVVDRTKLVKGYEYAKDQYVRFTDDELKALEGERTSAVDITEFVPLESVDLLHVDRTVFLGPDKGGAKAYHLLSRSMERTGRVALGRYGSRGREQLVLIRPYQGGLILHHLFYADEVRAFEDIDLGDEPKFRPGEQEMAEQLVEQLSAAKFSPEEYKDEYRARIMAAVDQKVAGEEITVPPEMPTAPVIDLLEALKASLEQRQAVKPPKKAEPPADKAPRRRKKQSSTG